MTNNPARPKSRRPGASRRGSCTAAPCARNSPRPRRRSSSPRATSTPSAEQAEERFKSEAGFIYSRYANPTVAMFEERMRLLEGARGRARHGHRHGGGHRRAAVLPQGRRSHRRRARAVRLVPLCGRGPVPALRHRLDAGRRPRPAAWQRPCAPTPRPSSSRRRPTRRSTSSTSPPSREIAHEAGALVVVDNVFATPVLQKPLQARRRRRRLFRHQACRRPGPLPRRHRAGLAGLREGPPAQLPEAHRPVAQPVQCLGDAQGPGDAAPARARAMRGGGQDRRPSGRPEGRRRACSTAAAPTTRKRRSRSARCRASARS